MLNRDLGSEITDINEWAGRKLDVILEYGLSYMLIKET